MANDDIIAPAEPTQEPAALIHPTTAPQEPAPEPNSREDMRQTYRRLMADHTPSASDDDEQGGQLRGADGRFQSNPKDGGSPDLKDLNDPVDEHGQPVKASEDEPTPQDAKEPAEAGAKPDTPKPEGAPKEWNSLPHAVRAAWAKIPEEARGAIVASQGEMAGKLAESQRLAIGLGPIKTSMQNAVRDFPELAGMTPDAVAADAYNLARTRAHLQSDPIGTIVTVAQQLGVSEQLAAHFGGRGAPTPGSDYGQQQTQLQQQLQNYVPHDKVEQIVDQQIAMRDSQSEVNDFAAGHEHWNDVEHILPNHIEAAKLTSDPSISRPDLLKKAYETATASLGLMASTPQPSEKTAQFDPKRTEAVLNAKSANVRGASGSEREMSDRDRMRQVYRKHTKKG